MNNQHNSVTHTQFMAAMGRQNRANQDVNQDSETIIMGAISLFWKHSKNIAYLNHALNFSRARRGMRVNAVKAFLQHHTGAKFGKGQFVGGGKLEACPGSFNDLSSWIQWANEKAQEPAYNGKAMVLSLVKHIDRDIEKARENEDTTRVAALTESKIALAGVAS